MKQTHNFFSTILGFLLGRPADRKQKALKVQYKQLMKTGCKFYKFNRQTVTSDFAKFLFMVYKTVSPYREFFLSHGQDSKFAVSSIDYYLTEEQRELQEHFSGDCFASMDGGPVLESMRAEVMESFQNFQTGISSEQLEKINALYNGIILLKQFCLVDYYAMLRRFAPSIKENDFKTAVEFSDTEQKNVSLQIVDFASVAEGVIQYGDFKEVLVFLKTLLGDDAADIRKFNEMLSVLKSYRKRNVLELLSCLVQQDAEFQIKGFSSESDVVMTYIESISERLDKGFHELFSKKRDEMIAQLVRRLFGSENTQLLKNYTWEMSSMYEHAGFPAFCKCEELAYLHAFNEYYAKTVLAGFIDVFSMRAVSMESKYILKLSSDFHELLDRDNVLGKFDIQLSGKFQQGYKMNVLLEQSKNDPVAEEQLTAIIEKMNMTAQKIFIESIDKIQQLEETLQCLLEDRQSGTDRFVENWDNLDGFFKEPCEKQMVSMISTLQDFQSLMDCYN